MYSNILKTGYFAENTHTYIYMYIEPLLQSRRRMAFE